MNNQNCFGITFNKIKLFKRVLFIAIAVLILMLALEISFVGKSLTYFVKFIPQSTQRDLRNGSHYISTQIVVISLSTVFILLIPIIIYLTFYKTIKPLLIGIVVIVAIDVVTLVGCVYLLGGAVSYRSYLESINSTISQNSTYCTEGLCNVATCLRLSSYYTARKVTIAFMVVSQVAFIHIIPLAFFINKAKLKSQLLEIIV